MRLVRPGIYLWFIGVHPDAQAQGMGSALLQEIINRCNGLKRPICLETSVDRNLPFYKKFGFEVLHTLDVGYDLYQLRKS